MQQNIAHSEIRQADDTAAHIALLSVSWDEALLSFHLPRMTSVSAESLSPPAGKLAETEQVGTVGRLPLRNLAADTDYAVAVRWRDGETKLRFRTLPAPVGPRLMAFAAVADTHVSLAAENRKGRLFVESRAILTDIVDDANAAGLDFMLIAGDITNKPDPDEVAAAVSILDRLDCPCFAAPGDHDLADAPPLWQGRAGERNRHERIGDAGVFVLDTISGLGAETRRFLAERWRSDSAIRIVVCHHQLFPDDYIRFGKRKTVSGWEEHKAFLADIFTEPTLIYAGHQNVPSLARMGNALQVNLAQTCQYPCGWVMVEQYANGFYHTFRPIRSEVLNDYSRRESNRAMAFFNERQWDEAYRRGKDVGQSCFLHSFEGAP